jgi:predicted DNA-binding transcriptional regulator AlpA
MKETPQLIATTPLARALGVDDRTIYRWCNDPRVEFPAPIVINRRKYWDTEAVRAWRERMAAKNAA